LKGKRPSLTVGLLTLAHDRGHNRQRRHQLKAQQWVEFAATALHAIPTEKRDATIVFVGDHAIRKLNREFRGKDYATDVLSFPSQSEPFEKEIRDHLGEVVISAERAAAQAKRTASLLKTNCSN
jgi:probable rRNA maturation factor